MSNPSRIRSMLIIFLLSGILLGNFIAESDSVQVKHYTLYWQNQPRVGSMDIGDYRSFQFIFFNITIISDSNFMANTNITMLGWGSMSTSLVNDSLIGGSLYYDNAIPYDEDLRSGSIGNSQLDMEVVPYGSIPITLEIDNTTSFVANPIQVTWTTGGTYYPTLKLVYWDGANITQRFTDKPITIQSEPPNITVIVPTSEPTPVPTKFFAHIFPVGTDKNNIANTVLWCIFLPPLLFSSLFIVELEYHERKYIKGYRVKWTAIFGSITAVIVVILGDAYTFPPYGWQWTSLQGGVIGLIFLSSFLVIFLFQKQIFGHFAFYTKGCKPSKPKPNKKTKESTITDVTAKKPTDNKSENAN
jgi:hypothetical protein